MADDEQRLVMERVLRALESLAQNDERLNTRLGQLTATLERMALVQEADAVRIGRLEESVTQLAHSTDRIADTVIDTQKQIAALAITERNTNERLDRLASTVERFIIGRGNGSDGGSQT